MKKSFIALVVMLTMVALAAQKITSCPLSSTAPILDGKGDDPVWQQAEAFPINFDNRTGALTKPSGQVRLLVSGDRLHILATLEDKGLASYSFKGARDKIDWNHSFEIFLSPSVSSTKYYHFAIDPSNNLYDIISGPRLPRISILTSKAQLSEKTIHGRRNSQSR